MNNEKDKKIASKLITLIIYLQLRSEEKCQNQDYVTVAEEFPKILWKNYTEPAIHTANFAGNLLSFSNRTSSSEVLISTLLINSLERESYVVRHSVLLTKGDLADGNFQAMSAYRREETIYFGKEDVHPISAKLYANLSKVNYTEGPYRPFYAESSYKKGSTLINFKVPRVAYEHGEWSSIFLDCTQLRDTVITFGVPILKYSRRQHVYFAGISTIDLAVDRLDLNQCDPGNETDRTLDFFAGTHHCQPTTECHNKPNYGISAGSYLCKCVDGYFYPRAGSDQTIEGRDIDKFITIYLYSGTKPPESQLKNFTCTPCAKGCKKCLNLNPCTIEIPVEVRYILLFCVGFVIVSCLIFSICVNTFKNKMVMKSASPSFLQLMCLGAVCQCFTIVFTLAEPNFVMCGLVLWTDYLGYFTMYGSLFLKTWRISVIFHVGSKKKLNLPNSALLEKLTVLLALVFIYMVIWMIIETPSDTELQNESKLKFLSCSRSVFDDVMIAAKYLFMLYGVYLCYWVRKTPLQFNESKFISQATYHAFVGGIFFFLLEYFFGYDEGPSFVAGFKFGQFMSTVSIPMFFIFIPKLWALYTKKEQNSANTMLKLISDVSTTNHYKETWTKIEAATQTTISRQATNQRR